MNAQWTKSNRYPLNKKISPHHVEQAPDIHNIKCHAPRERVSWNSFQKMVRCDNVGHAPRERVSWNHCQVLQVQQADGHAPRERVSWNVFPSPVAIEICRHAPRERVSWNLKKAQSVSLQEVTLHVSVWVEIAMQKVRCEMPDVTLHVSVWVEINNTYLRYLVTASRSTWACELKS